MSKKSIAVRSLQQIKAGFSINVPRLTDEELRYYTRRKMSDEDSFQFVSSIETVPDDADNLVIISDDSSEDSDIEILSIKSPRLVAFSDTCETCSSETSEDECSNFDGEVNRSVECEKVVKIKNIDVDVENAYDTLELDQNFPSHEIPEVNHQNSITKSKISINCDGNSASSNIRNETVIRLASKNESTTHCSVSQDEKIRSDVHSVSEVVERKNSSNCCTECKAMIEVTPRRNVETQHLFKSDDAPTTNKSISESERNVVTRDSVSQANSTQNNSTLIEKRIESSSKSVQNDATKSSFSQENSFRIESIHDRVSVAANSSIAEEKKNELSLKSVQNVVNKHLASQSDSAQKIIIRKQGADLGSISTLSDKGNELNSESEKNITNYSVSQGNSVHEEIIRNHAGLGFITVACEERNDSNSEITDSQSNSAENDEIQCVESHESNVQSILVVPEENKSIGKIEPHSVSSNSSKKEEVRNTEGNPLRVTHGKKTEISCRMERNIIDFLTAPRQCSDEPKTGISAISSNVSKPKKPFIKVKSSESLGVTENFSDFSKLLSSNLYYGIMEKYLNYEIQKIASLLKEISTIKIETADQLSKLLRNVNESTHIQKDILTLKQKELEKILRGEVRSSFAKCLKSLAFHDLIYKISDVFFKTWPRHKLFLKNTLRESLYSDEMFCTVSVKHFDEVFDKYLGKKDVRGTKRNRPAKAQNKVSRLLTSDASDSLNFSRPYTLPQQSSNAQLCPNNDLNSNSMVSNIVEEIFQSGAAKNSSNGSIANNHIRTEENANSDQNVLRNSQQQKSSNPHTGLSNESLNAFMSLSSDTSSISAGCGENLDQSMNSQRTFPVQLQNPAERCSQDFSPNESISGTSLQLFANELNCQNLRSLLSGVNTSISRVPQNSGNLSTNVSTRNVPPQQYFGNHPTSVPQRMPCSNYSTNLNAQASSNQRFRYPVCAMPRYQQPMNPPYMHHVLRNPNVLSATPHYNTAVRRNPPTYQESLVQNYANLTARLPLSYNQCSQNSDHQSNQHPSTQQEANIRYSSNANNVYVPVNRQHYTNSSSNPISWNSLNAPRNLDISQPEDPNRRNMIYCNNLTNRFGNYRNPVNNSYAPSQIHRSVARSSVTISHSKITINDKMSGLPALQAYGIPEKSSHSFENSARRVSYPPQEEPLSVDEVNSSVSPSLRPSPIHVCDVNVPRERLSENTELPISVPIVQSSSSPNSDQTTSSSNVTLSDGSDFLKELCNQELAKILNS